MSEAESTPLVELLRADDPPVAVCDECGRKTWKQNNVRQGCWLPQPNGQKCLGRFEPLTP